MNHSAQLESPNGMNLDWPSVERFDEWLAADPANHEHWSRIVDGITQGSYGNLPPKMVAKAKHLAAKHHEARCLKKLNEKFMEIGQVMSHSPGSMQVEDRLSQLNTLMDEIMDILLETPEPHRTEHLNRVLPARDWLRAYKVE